MSLFVVSSVGPIDRVSKLNLIQAWRCHWVITVHSLLLGNHYYDSQQTNHSIKANPRLLSMINSIYIYSIRNKSHIIIILPWIHKMYFNSPLISVHHLRYEISDAWSKGIQHKNYYYTGIINQWPKDGLLADGMVNAIYALEWLPGTCIIVEPINCTV